MLILMTTKDALSRIKDAEEMVYSASLLKKIRAVAKSNRHLRRVLTEAEAQEVRDAHFAPDINGWFLYHGKQIVLTTRDVAGASIFRM